MTLLETKKAYFCHPFGDCGILGWRDFEIDICGLATIAGH